MNSPASPWPAAPRTRKPLLSLAVLLGHGLMGWALLHLGLVQAVVAEVQPLMVSVVQSQEPPPPAPPLPVKVQAPQVTPPPLVLTVPDVPVPRDAPPSPLVAVAAPAVPTPTPQSTPVASTAVVAPPPPPALMKVPPTALRYVVQPPVEVPLISKRLREQGVVVLRVVVDVRGLPRVVQLARSSGFERLDQQALGAMRQARFQPCLRDGQPIECESEAPFSYELE
jgi:protein TonB